MSESFCHTVSVRNGPLTTSKQTARQYIHEVQELLYQDTMALGVLFKKRLQVGVSLHLNIQINMKPPFSHTKTIY